MARIFILDESEKIKAHLKQLLHAQGHETILFNGEESFDAIIRDTIFDVMIIELNAKSYNPFEKIAEIHSIAKNKNTFIVATITSPQKELLDKCRQFEVNQIFVKPYSFKVLADKINSYFYPNKNASTAFDLSIIKIFLESTLQIFKANAQISLSAGKPFLKSQSTSVFDISAVIGLSSAQIKGSVAVNVAREVLERTYFKMLGETIESREQIREEDLTDICGELANQILGRVKQLFLKFRDTTFEITVPSIVKGPQHIINYKLSAPVLVIPFHFENKECLFIEFCLDFNNDAAVVPSEKLTVAAEDGEFLLF